MRHQPGPNCSLVRIAAWITCACGLGTSRCCHRLVPRTGVPRLRLAKIDRRISRQPFRSAEHYVEFFRKYFGPTQMAYERVGPEGEQALTDDLLAFLNEANTAGDRAMVLEAEYLQLVATRA